MGFGMELMVFRNRTTMRQVFAQPEGTESPAADGGATSKGVIVPDAVRLTATAYKKVGTDADKAEMLTQKEVEAIATKLNQVINLPILKENREQIIFVKIVKQIDRFLYGVLPNELYELIRVASDGITEKDALIIEENLTKLANDYINLPFLTEPMEETVFRVIIGIIVRAMLKGKSIKE